MEDKLQKLGFEKNNSSWFYDGQVQINISSIKNNLIQIDFWFGHGLGENWPRLITIEELEQLIKLVE